MDVFMHARTYALQCHRYWIMSCSILPTDHATYVLQVPAAAAALKQSAAPVMTGTHCRTASARSVMAAILVWQSHLAVMMPTALLMQRARMPTSMC